MSRRIAVGCSAVALVWLAGCRQALELDSFEEVPVACRELGYPERSAVPDDGDIEIVLAQRTWSYDRWPRLGGRSPIDEVGFNLDRRCTTATSQTSCRTSSAALQVDGVAGKDNAGARLLLQFDVLKGLFDLAIAAEDQGQRAAVFRIRNYNGKPDDSSVQVDYFGATMQTGGVASAPPTWNGEDQWHALSNWLAADIVADGGSNYSTERPMFRDSDAYVSHGKLVAHFDKLFLGDALTLRRIVVAADLVQDNGRWQFKEAVLGGRWAIEDALLNLHDILADEECKLSSQITPDTLSTYMCRYADLRADDDNTSAQCDAISWAYLFSAFQARLDHKIESFQKRCPAPDIGSAECE